MERSGKSPLLEPVLTYQVILPDGADAHVMLKNLRLLEEEDPLLHIVWDETLGEIRAQVMGQVQMEILKSQILERFGVEADFGTGNIVYKETIQRPVEGVGHFEPLRHYAEVHLLMEPLEPGSGLVLGCDCSEDLLEPELAATGADPPGRKKIPGDFDWLRNHGYEDHSDGGPGPY